MELVKSSAKNKDIKLKTQINFVGVQKKKKTNWFLVVPGTIIIVVLSVLFSRFFVVDRFTMLNAAQANLRSLEEEMEADKKILSNSGDMTETFYHYTWSDMTDEEKERISRVDVLTLGEFISSKGASISSYRVVDDVVDAEIVTDSMDSVSKLSNDIQGESIVNSVSVTNVKKEIIEDSTDSEGKTVKGGVIVTAQLKVYLKNKSTIAAEKNALAQAEGE